MIPLSQFVKAKRKAMRMTQHLSDAGLTMRKAEVLLHDRPVGVLEELDRGYRFTCSVDYLNDPKAVTSSNLRWNGFHS